MNSSDTAPTLSADAHVELAAAIERSLQLQKELLQLHQRILELHQQTSQSRMQTLEGLKGDATSAAKQ